jgi:hypothetical protein
MTIHLRHHDIGEHQIELFRGALRDGVIAAAPQS